MYGICTKDFERGEAVYIDDSGKIYKKEPQTIQIEYNMTNKEHEIMYEEISGVLEKNGYVSVKGAKVTDLKDSSNVCIKLTYSKLD